MLNIKIQCTHYNMLLDSTYLNVATHVCLIAVLCNAYCMHDIILNDPFTIYNAVVCKFATSCYFLCCKGKENCTKHIQIKVIAVLIVTQNTGITYKTHVVYSWKVLLHMIFYMKT